MVFWEKFMYHQNTLKIFSHQYVDMFAVYTTQTNNQNSVAFCSCEFHYDRWGLTPWEVHKYVLRIFTFPSLTNFLQSTGFSSSQTQTRSDRADKRLHFTTGDDMAGEGNEVVVRLQPRRWKMREVQDPKETREKGGKGSSTGLTSTSAIASIPPSRPSVPSAWKPTGTLPSSSSHGPLTSQPNSTLLFQLEVTWLNLHSLRPYTDPKNSLWYVDLNRDKWNVFIRTT